MLLFLANVIVVTADLYPEISTLVGRRQMGALQSDDEYLRAVREVALIQLERRKALPGNDSRRLRIIDEWRRWRRHEVPFSWPHAVLATGIAIHDDVEPDSTNVAALKTYFDSAIDADGKLVQPIRDVDQAMNGRPLMHLESRTGDARYRVALDEMARYLIERGKREGNTIAYRPRMMPGVRLVDTLAMICPFLAEYGARYQCPDAIELAVDHLDEFARYGLEPRSGLPYHGYNRELDNYPVGVVGWGRGTGWYAIGLIDTFPWVSARADLRKRLEQYIVQLAETARECRLDDGGWNGIMNSESPFDSSATAMIAYFLQRAMLEKVIDQDYAADVQQAVAALKRRTRSDGTVDFAQGALMGLNRHSKLYAPAPYAQGAVLALMVHVANGAPNGPPSLLEPPRSDHPQEADVPSE